MPRAARSPGDPPGRPRLPDVALRAGVSNATVSNVLNHPERVAPETLRRVEQAMAALGYSPNTMASALARGDTRTLGLVVIDLSNSLFVDIARGAQRLARQQAFALRLAFSDDDATLLDAHMRGLVGARVSGMLIAPLESHREAIDAARRDGTPVVVLNHDAPEDDACRVLVDNERAGYLAARHLVELGRRHIAFVAGHDDLQPVARRRAGVRRAVAEEPGVRLTEVATASLEAPAGALAGHGVASLPPGERPDAVLAVTDVLAMAVVNELVAAGVRVPEEVAVMGCDHNSAAWGGAVPLSSVTMEGERMGAEGVRLLLRELGEDPATHEHEVVVLEPSLVVRESTVGRRS